MHLTYVLPGFVSVVILLYGSNIDIECDDVNVAVAQCDTSVSRLLDKHAPLKRYVLLIDP